MYNLVKTSEGMGLCNTYTCLVPRIPLSGSQICSGAARSRPSHRTDTGSGGMDELEAAAAVLAVATDGFADEDLEQRPTMGSVAGGEAHLPTDEVMAVDKENLSVDAAPRDTEDGAHKVLFPTRAPLRKPCRQPLPPSGSHAHMSRKPCCRRSRWTHSWMRPRSCSRRA